MRKQLYSRSFSLQGKLKVFYTKMMVMDMDSLKVISCWHIMLLNFNPQLLQLEFPKLKDLGRGQVVVCMCNYCLGEVQLYVFSRKSLKHMLYVHRRIAIQRFNTPFLSLIHQTAWYMGHRWWGTSNCNSIRAESLWPGICQCKATQNSIR